jgi:lysophospholipase L1-like esterase
MTYTYTAAHAKKDYEAKRAQQTAETLAKLPELTEQWIPQWASEGRGGVVTCLPQLAVPLLLSLGYQVERLTKDSSVSDRDVYLLQWDGLPPNQLNYQTALWMD